MTRDTDADWVRIAEAEPFFGVLADPGYLRDSLDEMATERFYASGRADIAHAVNTIRQHLDAEFHPSLAVDFGCGVGRLSIAMREHAASVVGLDVAPGMRTLAAERAASVGLTDIRFTDTAPSAGIDWLNSLIVFQHVPPARGMQILQELVCAMSPKAVLSVQLTTHRDRGHLHEILRDVAMARFDGVTMAVLDNQAQGPIGQMTMFDYDLGAVLAMLTRHGFGRLWLEHTDHGGVHGYWIFANRGG